jgi:hypothetical protein
MDSSRTLKTFAFHELVVTRNHVIADTLHPCILRLTAGQRIIETLTGSVEVVQLDQALRI